VYLGLYQIGTIFFPDSYLSGNEFQVNFMSGLVYKTVILLFTVRGCEMWLLILRREYRLMVFESMVLKKILYLELKDKNWLVYQLHYL
jgi:hypothetical protein